MKPRIKILTSKRINKEKWDACVMQHSNGLIYASSVYLTAMAKNWSGLVIDDYTAVMPLPWKKKLAIRYGYTPAFSQQLGLIGEASNADMVRVLKLVYRFVAFADIHFNFANSVVQQLVPVIPRTNLVIDLSAGYDTIKSNYKTNLKENIRKANAGTLQYTEGDIQKAITMYHTEYKGKIKHVHEKDYKHFTALCESLKDLKGCFVRMAQDTNKKIFSIGLFLKDNKRIYNIMNTTTQEGRMKEANHFLLNQVIHEFAGQPLLFDFEGSELSGVREFYENFGAVNQPYFHYSYNGYTWPLEILKRHSPR